MPRVRIRPLHRAGMRLRRWLIATDAYVRSTKYAKHAFRGVTYDTSGLPAATEVSLCLWPRAVRFVGRHDRTYATFGDRACHPAIVSYDHRTRQWSKPRQIGRTGAVDDSHGLPTLAIDGRDISTWSIGSHGGKQYVARSSAPEEIDRWDPPAVVAPDATYSDLYFVGDTLHIFHRERAGQWGFRTSGDGGKTWSEFRAVCQAFTEPYSGVFYPGLSLGERKTRCRSCTCFGSTTAPRAGRTCTTPSRPTGATPGSGPTASRSDSRSSTARVIGCTGATPTGGSTAS